MRTQKAILGLFNIRASEFDKFIRLLTHAFLNGLGLALSFSAISVMILDQHGAEPLPYMYVGTAFLLLIGGLVYSKLEHSIPAPRLFATALILCALWAFLMRFTTSFHESIIILGIAFCTYYLVYLLSNLEFWGSAALLFDIRQGKRIFGPLTTGESVAKILGFALTPVVANITCMQDALLISALCFALSYFLLKGLVRRYPHAYSHGHHHHGPHKKIRSFRDLKLFEAFGSLKKDRFIRYLSIFALLSTTAYFVIYYGFMDQIKIRYKKVEDIALFFGVFLSVAKALNHIIKIFLTSRLLSYVGVRKVLYALPLILLLVNLVGIIGFLSDAISTRYFISIMVLNYAIDYSLRTSIYTPTYLIMFQPLTKTKRLEGHTVSKGIMEPIGIGLAGLSILLFKYLGYYDLQIFILILLVVSVVWLFFAHLVGSEYIHLLRRALKAKIFKQGTFELSLEERDDLRSNRLNSKDPVEVLYAAQLLKDELTEKEKEKIVDKLLSTSDNRFITHAMQFTTEHNIRQFSGHIKEYIMDPELGEHAAFCYASLMEEECVDELLRDSHRWDDEIKTSIIGGVLKHSGLYGAVSLGQEFLELLKSEDESDRINAARIIGKINNRDYYHPLLILLKDSSLEVRKQAILSSGDINNPKLINPVLDNILEPRLFSSIKRAMLSFGPRAIPKIVRSIKNAPPHILLSGIRILSQFEHDEATSFLVNQLSSSRFDIRKEAALALAKLYRVFTSDQNEQINGVLKDSAAHLKSLIENYERCKPDTLLKAALKNEIMAVNLPMLLNLLSLKYDSEIIANIKDNTEIREGDYRSNALELLENHLNRRDASKITPLIERIFTNVDSEIKTAITPADLSDTVQHVFEFKNELLSDWLKAVALREAGNQKIRLNKKLLESHDLSGQLLKEEYLNYQK